MDVLSDLYPWLYRSYVTSLPIPALPDSSDAHDEAANSTRGAGGSREPLPLASCSYALESYSNTTRSRRPASTRSRVTTSASSSTFTTRLISAGKFPA